MGEGGTPETEKRFLLLQERKKCTLYLQEVATKIVADARVDVIKNVHEVLGGSSTREPTVSRNVGGKLLRRKKLPTQSPR